MYLQKNSINSRMQGNYIIFWLARTFLFSFYIYKSGGGTSHFTLHILHFILRTSDFTLHTIQTLRFTHFRLHASHTSDSRLHTSLHSSKFKTPITYEQEFWQELAHTQCLTTVWPRPGFEDNAIVIVNIPVFLLGYLNIHILYCTDSLRFSVESNLGSSRIWSGVSFMFFW